MAPAQRELILMHCAWPHAPEHRDEAGWRRASATVLEGAYSQWLVSQGRVTMFRFAGKTTPPKMY
jgi:hypothetical protein